MDSGTCNIHVILRHYHYTRLYLVSSSVDTIDYPVDLPEMLHLHFSLLVKKYSFH